MSTIRVLRVIARMNVGGPALQVTGLHDGLDAQRFEQRLLAGDVDEGEADYVELRAPHLQIEKVPGLGRSPSPIGDLRALLRIRRIIKTFKPHIVHTHTAKAGVLGRAAAFGKVPVRVHTFHGHLLHGYFSPFMTKRVIGVERAFAKRTTKLVAVGARVRDDLLAAGIGRPDQYVVVPPGIQLLDPPSRAAARAQLAIPADALAVAFVARLTHVKRPDRFADVVHQVVRERSDVVFAVAGEGDLLDELREQLADVEDQVRFLGWRSDVETIYAACDAVVLTSDNEGMPVSLIEAASVGCPAVTTDVGSAREVVLDGQTGFVVDVDADALAATTLRLLADDELRQRFAVAAREHAAQHFSRDRLVSDIAALYEELMAESDA
ncbi:MAG: glycosyltransferase family 4 protein [Actinobacteria bacterium]|nr:glycosyltransferase family 4 protein [Actinomycetota bacterium]